MSSEGRSYSREVKRSSSASAVVEIFCGNKLSKCSLELRMLLQDIDVADFALAHKSAGRVTPAVGMNSRQDGADLFTSVLGDFLDVKRPSIITSPSIKEDVFLDTLGKEQQEDEDVRVWTTHCDGCFFG